MAGGGVPCTQPIVPNRLDRATVLGCGQPAKRCVLLLALGECLITFAQTQFTGSMREPLCDSFFSGALS
jgi:hypothetical protein